MSRYVNADAIKEKKWQAESEACFYALEDVVSVTDIDETDDAIDLVRCKECRYWRTREDDTNCCVREYATDHWCADDFCSYGEREGE